MIWKSEKHIFSYELFGLLKSALMDISPVELVLELQKLVRGAKMFARRGHISLLQLIKPTKDYMRYDNVGRTARLISSILDGIGLMP